VLQSNWHIGPLSAGLVQIIQCVRHVVGDIGQVQPIRAAGRGQHLEPPNSPSTERRALTPSAD
jgi:hypothetical protein